MMADDIHCAGGIERISNCCHICDTKLVWHREAERSFCPECNAKLLRSLHPDSDDMDRGDGPRTDGGVAQDSDLNNREQEADR